MSPPVCGGALAARPVTAWVTIRTTHLSFFSVFISFCVSFFFFLFSDDHATLFSRRTSLCSFPQADRHRLTPARQPAIFA